MGAVGRIWAQALMACCVFGGVVVACGGSVADGDASMEGGDPAVSEDSEDGAPSVEGAASTGAEGGAQSESGASPIADAAEPGADADAAQPLDGSLPDAGQTDDPCPAKLDVNCSMSCGSMVECSKLSCAPTVGGGFIITNDNSPFVLRTPSSPGSLTQSGVPPRCIDNCSGAVPSYHLIFRIYTTEPRVRIRVEPPWFISAAPAAGGNDLCHDRMSCVVTLGNGSISTIAVMTSDPNAPARNVIIEDTPDGCLTL